MLLENQSSFLFSSITPSICYSPSDEAQRSRLYTVGELTNWWPGTEAKLILPMIASPSCSNCTKPFVVRSLLFYTEFFVLEINNYCLVPKQSIACHSICFIVNSKSTMIGINFYVTKLLSCKFKCIFN